MIRASSFVLALAWGCGLGREGPAVTPSPEMLTDQACGVCGMVVREQPAPRGQVMHRDGTHAHFCSLGDLRAHLDAPSPHGAIVGTWVEALPAGFDPATTRHPPLAVVPAEDAWYVVGIERRGVMGRPVLSFTTRGEADATAIGVGGRVVDWTALTAAPSHLDPP